MAEKELRYGISALSTEYLEYAEDDEILIRNDGKIFYKRQDGQVVSYDTHDFNRETLSVSMNTALTKTGESFIDLVDTDSVLYSKIDLINLTNILDSRQQVFGRDYIFKVSPNEPGMYIRARGTATLNGVMEFIRSYWLAKNPNTMNINPITIYIKLTASDNTTTTMTVSCNIDELVYVKFALENVVEVQIVGILFNYLEMYESIPAEMRNQLIQINDSNAKYELTCFDVITYINNLDNAILNSKENKINMVSAVIGVEAETVGDQLGIVVSKTKPTFPCVWAKVLD